MSIVGFQSHLFSGFFSTEGSRPEFRSPESAPLFEMEQFLPLTADFSRFIRSAVLETEPQTWVDAKPGRPESFSTLEALAAFASEWFGREIRLEPVGETEVFRIHRMLGRADDVPEFFLQLSVDEGGGLSAESAEEIGLLWVGETVVFTHESPRNGDSQAQAPSQALLFFGLEPPAWTGLTNPAAEGAFDSSVRLSVAIPETPELSTDRLNLTLIANGEAVKTHPPESNANETNEESFTKPLATATQSAAKIPTFHPDFVQAVQVALARAVQEFAASSIPDDKAESTPENRRSHGGIPEALSDPELAAKPVPTAAASNPISRDALLGVVQDAPPPSSNRADSKIPGTEPLPRSETVSIKIPVRGAAPSLTAADAPEVHEVLSFERKPSRTLSTKNPIPTTSKPLNDAPPVSPPRVLPVQVKFVLGEIAERLEALSGRILDTRSEISRGIAAPVGQPILSGSSWRPGLEGAISVRPAPSTGKDTVAPSLTGGEARTSESKNALSTKPVLSDSSLAKPPAQVVPTATQSTPRTEAVAKPGPPNPNPPAKESNRPTVEATRSDSEALDQEPTSKRAPKGDLEPSVALRRTPVARTSGNEPNLLVGSARPNPAESGPVGHPERQTAPVMVLSESPGTVPRGPAASRDATLAPLPQVESEAVDQIARALRGRSGREGSEMKIRLVPESLGEIHLRVSIRGGRIVAEIRASSEGTREMLTRNAVQLQTLLGESGTGIERVVVRTGAFGGDLQTAAGSSRESSPDSDPREQRGKESKEREDPPSQNRDQSRGNKRRNLWDRFL